APGNAEQDGGQGGPGHLLGSSAGLQEPDAHAQSRRALLHDLLQHEGRADRSRPAARRQERILQRQHRECLADAARRRGIGRCRQGKGRQIPDSSPKFGLMFRAYAPTKALFTRTWGAAGRREGRGAVSEEKPVTEWDAGAYNRVSALQQRLAEK